MGVVLPMLPRRGKFLRHGAIAKMRVSLTSSYDGLGDREAVQMRPPRPRLTLMPESRQAARKKSAIALSGTRCPPPENRHIDESTTAARRCDTVGKQTAMTLAKTCRPSSRWSTAVDARPIRIGPLVDS